MDDKNQAGLSAQNPGVPDISEAPPAMQAAAEQHAAAEQQAPTPEEMAEKQRAENLQKAIANGYKEPVPPSIEERKARLLADMDHAVANNGPITVAMMAEIRDLLGVSA